MKSLKKYWFTIVKDTNHHTLASLLVARWYLTLQLVLFYDGKIVPFYIYPLSSFARLLFTFSFSNEYVIVDT